MTKIIAEIGWNHMGDMELAKKMIDAAANNGADYAKFQTWKVERLKKGSWDTDGRKEIYNKAELSKNDHILLKEYCDLKGIKFMSSVFSVNDAQDLKEITTECVKIPSFESTNLDLLKYVNDNFDWVVISTGTTTLEEVKKTLKVMEKDKTTILHCVSSYPCSPENANLPKLETLKQLTPHVGYSDHSEGVEIAKVSLEYGIEVIEKHFTINRELPGRDNKFAILPENLKDLKNYIEIRKKTMIPHGDDFQEIELDSRINYRGRFNG